VAQTNRTIVIGDIHGCLVELLRLLLEVNYVQGVDRLISVGDLMDRGPYPNAVVDFLQRLQVEVLLGNHEEKHLRWLMYEMRKDRDPSFVNPCKLHPEYQDSSRKLSVENKVWLVCLPSFVRFEHAGKQWLVTHGGVPTDKPVEQQDRRKLCRCRFVNQDTGAYSSTHDPKQVPKNAVRWTERWKGPESVVYGHIVHPSMQIQDETVADGVRCIGIDTGCCFGGHLTAAVFDPAETQPYFVQVQAERAYKQLRLGQDISD